MGGGLGRRRPLARVFVAETGLSFGRWRTLARLQAALLQLAEGRPVGLVAAFRAHTGVTPGRYFDAATSSRG